MRASGVSEYRLLMFQPDPESGERICVGVTLEGRLLFDPSFSRVHCLAKKIGMPHLRVLIDDICEALFKSRGDDIERISQLYAPMFQLSPPRKVASPLDQRVRDILFKRFVTGENDDSSRTSRGQARKKFSSELKSLASSVLGREQAGYRLIENAKSEDVLGDRRDGIRRVAVAIKREDHTVLLDGLDLNLLSDHDALRECTNVVRTFWQYKIAPKPPGERISRLAVIFNGSAPPASPIRDVHAFVSTQFERESEKTIEAHSGKALDELAGMLT